MRSRARAPPATSTGWRRRCRGPATSTWSPGFPSRSFPYIEESRQLAAEIGDETLMLLPLFIATWWLVDRDPAAAVKALEEVIELARKQQATDVEGHAMVYRAVALARLGDFAAARAEIAKALEIAPRAGSPVKEADIHIGAGEAYYDMGEIEKGLEHARIGAELAYNANGFECACAGHFRRRQGAVREAPSRRGALAISPSRWSSPAGWLPRDFPAISTRSRPAPRRRSSRRGSPLGDRIAAHCAEQRAQRPR